MKSVKKLQLSRYTADGWGAERISQREGGGGYKCQCGGYVVISRDRNYNDITECVVCKHTAIWS